MGSILLETGTSDTYKLKEEIIALQLDGKLPSFEGKKVLEIGCGAGFSSKLLRELGANVTAIELDEKRAYEGIKAGNFDGVNLLVPKDARDYQFDASFDHLFGFHIGPLCTDSDEELTIPQIWKNILRNTTSHIKREGMVFLSYHCGEDTDLQEYLESIHVKGNAHPRVSHSDFANAYFMGKVGLPVNVFLVGTVHKDIRGKQRLEKILEHIKPDCITIEADQFFLRLAEEIDFLASLTTEKQREILNDVYGVSDIPNAGLAAFLNSYLFEIRTAREYAKRNGIRFIPADPTMTQVFSQQLQYAQESHEANQANESNVSTASKFEHEWNALVLSADEEGVRTLSGKVDRFYSCSDREIPIESTETRDSNYINAIREKAHEVMVHICGASHLIGNYNNLSRRLDAEGIPHKIVLLNSADTPTIYRELHTL